jgi:hypothetical protein
MLAPLLRAAACSALVAALAAPAASLTADVSFEADAVANTSSFGYRAPVVGSFRIETDATGTNVPVTPLDVAIEGVNEEIPAAEGFVDRTPALTKIAIGAFSDLGAGFWQLEVNLGAAGAPESARFFILEGGDLYLAGILHVSVSIDGAPPRAITTIAPDQVRSDLARFVCRRTQRAVQRYCATWVPEGESGACETHADCPDSGAVPGRCASAALPGGIPVRITDPIAARATTARTQRGGATLCSKLGGGRNPAQPIAALRGVGLARRDDAKGIFAAARGWGVTTELGTVTIDAPRVDRLLLSAIVDPLGERVPQHPSEALPLDTFRCAKAVATVGATAFAPLRGVRIDDAFGRPQRVDVLRPARLCRAVGVEADAPNYPGDMLLCFRTRPEARKPADRVREGETVWVGHPLGAEPTEVGEPVELCVPAERTS